MNAFPAACRWGTIRICKTHRIPVEGSAFRHFLLLAVIFRENGFVFFWVAWATRLLQEVEAVAELWDSPSSAPIRRPSSSPEAQQWRKESI